MNLLDYLGDMFKNFMAAGQYKTHSEAVVVSCFFNPQKSLYRLKAFNKFYKSIQNLNYRIIECAIGEDNFQLPEDPNIIRVRAETLLWHKEGLLNRVIADLPDHYKYVFWVDADVIFTNLNWLREGVEQFQNGAKILQPFEYCVHLDKNDKRPSFNVDEHKGLCDDPVKRHKKLWRGFCANYVDKGRRNGLSASTNYDVHGHVGFAWGATREVLEQVPLYDRALVGGADHIIAHAAAGQIPHHCITKSFTDDIDEVLAWSYRFYDVVGGNIGYVPGDLYHIWHGDISRRQYLKRIKDYTKQSKTIVHKDKNGLYIADPNDKYVKRYFQYREVRSYDADFEEEVMWLEDLGYLLEDLYYAYEDYQAWRNDHPDEIYEDYTPEELIYEEQPEQGQQESSVITEEQPDIQIESPTEDISAEGENTDYSDEDVPSTECSDDENFS